MLFVMVGRHKALRRPAENSELRAQEKPKKVAVKDGESGRRRKGE